MTIVTIAFTSLFAIISLLFAQSLYNNCYSFEHYSKA